MTGERGARPSDPSALTVDDVFALLNEALLYAIEKGGNKAKSVAWDTRGYFISKIGHLRIAEPCSPTPITGDQTDD